MLNEKDDKEYGLLHQIEYIFGVNKGEISSLSNLHGSNLVYSFILKNQKYVIKKLHEKSIINWEQEKAAYISLKPLNITDELVYFENGIKITKYLDHSGKLTNDVSDMIEVIDLIRKVHNSNISINYNYDIIGNIDKYISLCDLNNKKVKELNTYGDNINAIQKIVTKMNISPVLCHGDACAPNFMRLSDNSIKVIDWEQAGMADPFLDIAIAALHDENIDPIWCLHQYLKRIPENQEYLRLFSYLALDSFALMAWYISEEDSENYNYYLNFALKYSGLVLNYYKDV